MHECPACGQACICDGDIDDCKVMHPDWVQEYCEHCDPEEELAPDVFDELRFDDDQPARKVKWLRN